MTVKPRQPAPELEFDLVGGGRWRLAEQHPRTYTMIVFYRGLHCPVCQRYTSELNGMLEEFEKRGVSVVVTSADDKQRAEQAKAEWRLDGLTVGYSVPIETARHWGLFISNGRPSATKSLQDPARFSEPGIFLVKPDATLFWVSVSNMPFARPHFADVLHGIDFAMSRDYPARGEA